MDDEHKSITKNENDTDRITWKRPLENEMVVSLDERHEWDECWTGAA